MGVVLATLVACDAALAVQTSLERGEGEKIVIRVSWCCYICLERRHCRRKQSTTVWVSCVRTQRLGGRNGLHCNLFQPLLSFPTAVCAGPAVSRRPSTAHSRHFGEGRGGEPPCFV